MAHACRSDRGSGGREQKTLLAVYTGPSPCATPKASEDSGRLLVEPLSRADHLQYVRLAEGAEAHHTAKSWTLTSKHLPLVGRVS